MQVQQWRSPSGRTLVLTLHGELDLSLGPDLRTALVEIPAVRLVVVDLQDVTFADSLVIGLLVGAQRRADREGWTFVVANAHGAVLKSMRVLGATRFLVDPQPVKPR